MSDHAELVYPLSVDYVADWDLERAIAELVSNAFDEDPKANVEWADGKISISDRGPGLTAQSLVIGHSPKNDSQIGQFGEGAKLAMLVIARLAGPEAMTIRTRGATLRPRIERHTFALDGDDCDVLVVEIVKNRRRVGTTVTVDCDFGTYQSVVDRFLQLSVRRYRPPESPGRVLADRPGEIRVGGVLVSRRAELVAGYDFATQDAKSMLNRDRTVLDTWELRSMIGRCIEVCADPAAAELLARAALSGRCDPVERVRMPYGTGPTRAWKTARRRVLGSAKTCWSASRSDAAALDLADRGWRVLEQAGDPESFAATMAALGVPNAERADRSNAKTVWVGRQRLSSAERANLSNVLRRARAVWGAECVGSVRVFASCENDSWTGFYDPSADVVAVRRDVLGDLAELEVVVAHEIAHRRAKLAGGEWQDRTRGFEQALSEMAAAALRSPARRRATGTGNAAAVGSAAAGGAEHAA